MSRLFRSRLYAAGIATTLAAVLAFGTAAPALAAEIEDDARPDRVVLTPAEDPATSQSFTWRTGADVTVGQVSIRKAGSSEAWRVVDAYQNDPLTGENDVSVRTHSVTVDGLQPNTEYEYFVGNADAVSETWTFTTAGAANDPFTFIYFGDAQNQLSDTWGTAVDAGFEHYPDAIGTVHAGDLINRSNSREWTEWFDGMDGRSQTINVIAAPGNHEYTDDSFLTHWKSNFEYPSNGPKWSGEYGATDAQRQEAAYREHMAEVLTETVYFTDYQGVRFISLNASRSQARKLFTPDTLPSCLIGCPDPTALWLDMQKQWLDEILSENPNQWAVATFHQPVFSTAVGRDEADLRASWLPVFQRNDIDLVLMGHDHTYARGYMNDDVTDTEGVTTGPVYAVAVAGPKYYDQQPADNNVWTQNGATQVIRAGNTSTVQGITVEGGTLRYESIVAAKWDGEAASTTDVPVGGVLDSFTITKYSNGEKYVTEDGVDIPSQQGADTVEPEPTEPEPTDETPAEEPADAPLVHLGHGALAAPTVAGPMAFDEASGTLFVADASPEGNGTIEAIDVATDEVLRSFDVGAPVTAMSFTPAEGGLLLIAAMDAEHGAQANGYAINPAFFGEPALSDNLPMPLPVTGVSIDPGTGYVYFAMNAAGLIVVVDLDSGAIAGQVPMSGVSDVKVDEATGNVYVTADQGDGAGELSIYQAGLTGEPIREYALRGAPRDVDLDTAAGLAYVSHSGDDSGVSAVDVLNGDVLFESGVEVGSSVVSLATNSADEIVYVMGEAGVSMLARAQAPRIIESPASTAVGAGERATLSAAAIARPEPAVQWQIREGDTWADIAGATSAELMVIPETTAQYRAVFSNVIADEVFSTASATATVSVREENDSDSGADNGAGAQTGEGTGSDSNADAGAIDDSAADTDMKSDAASDGTVGPESDADDVNSDDSLARTGSAEDLRMVAVAVALLAALGTVGLIANRLKRAER